MTLLPDNRYDFATGSSLAAAHMTGAAALLLSVNPRLSPPMVYELLRNATTGSAVQAGGTEGVDACTAVIALVA